MIEARAYAVYGYVVFELDVLAAQDLWIELHVRVCRAAIQRAI